MSAEALAELESGPAPESFDLSWLEYQLERIAELEKAMAQNEAVVAQAMERLKLRHEKVQEPLRNEKERLEAAVRGYAEVHRKALLVGKRKSRALPAGKVGWRWKPEKLEVLQKGALHVWAEERHFIRTVEEPDMKAIRDYFQRTGEVPEGCEVRPPEETFYVSTAEDTEEEQ